MARTYFKFGNTRVNRHDTDLLTKNCWKYAFYQGFQEREHGMIEIWVWLDTDAIRLVGFGNIFVSQAIIQRLDIYSQAITEILRTFPVSIHKILLLIYFKYYFLGIM